MKEEKSIKPKPNYRCTECGKPFHEIKKKEVLMGVIVCLDCKAFEEEDEDLSF